MTWRREDTAYAAAAIAAAALVVYFVIGNFGLVPSPLGGGRTAFGNAIAVPHLATTGAVGTATSRPRAATAVPPVPTPGGPSPAALPTRPAVDRTPPTARITTASGTQLSVTSPSTIDGTASDTGSGVRSVTVTFTPSAGGPATTTPAHVVCTNASDRSCRWSAKVPAVAGQYGVSATAVDRQGNASRSSSISITVVNGGTVVGTVTDLVNGLTGVIGAL